MTLKQKKRALKARIKQLFNEGHTPKSATPILIEEGFTVPTTGAPLRPASTGYWARAAGKRMRKVRGEKPRRAYKKRDKYVEFAIKEAGIKNKKSSIIDQILNSDLDKRAKLAILEHLI